MQRIQGMGAGCFIAMVACGEKTAPLPEPSTSTGAVVTSVAPTAEQPIVRSPIVPTLDGETAILHVAAYREGEAFGPGAQSSSGFRVFGFRDRVIVTQAGHVWTLDGDKLTRDDKAVTTEKVKGETPILGAYEVTRMDGVWPSALWVEAHFSSFLGARQSSSRDVRYRRLADTWEIQKELPGSITPWTKGSVLGLVNGELTKLTGDGAPPAQARATKSERCVEGRPAVSGVQIAALESGEVFLLGQHCEDGRMVVERWASGAEASVIEELPDQPKDLASMYTRGHRLAAGSSSNVLVSLPTKKRAYVARWDGRAFRAVTMPEDGVVREAWATADGAAWMLVQEVDRYDRPSVVFRLGKDQSLKRHVAPNGRQLVGLWASDGETVYTAWDSADVGNGGALFSTRAKLLHGTPPEDFTKEKEKVKPKEEPKAPVVDKDEAPFPAFTETCTTPFVFLYDVSDNSPPTFDFPTTRKALASFAKVKEISLVEIVHRGKRRLALTVPSKAVADEAIAHIEATMKDEHPKLVCFEPKGDVRTITLP